MILTAVLGLVIGIALGSLGGGGSVLAVPVLVYVAGQSVNTATSTSLVAVGTSALFATVGHAVAGRVRWDAAGQFVVAGVLGSWAGTQAHRQLDADLTLLLFSMLVLVAAHRMLTACPTCTKEGESKALAAADQADGSHSSPQPTSLIARLLDPRVLGAGLAVGFLTGLFGVGGGFVIVPALTLAVGMNMPTAIATSLAVIVGNAAFALFFRGVGDVDWEVALPFTAAMLIGSTIGSRISGRLPAKTSLKAFAALLVAVALATGIASGIALAS